MRQDLRGGAFFRGKGVFFGAAGISFFVFLESSETAENGNTGLWDISLGEVFLSQR